MRKLIFRADDLGISDGVSCGIRKAITEGMITSTGMMTNMPTAANGYAMVKDTDVCLGMHGNISCGKPLSDPKEISSIVNEGGEFYSSKELNGPLRDLISVDDCIRELEAQLNEFVRITGRKPSYFEGHAVFSPAWMEAQKEFARKHDLFIDLPGFDPAWEAETGIGSLGWGEQNAEGLYDPKKLMIDGLKNLDQHEACVGIFHPGYIDQFLLEHSSYTKIRAMECDFLCSDWLKNFMKENNIQPVSFSNYRD